MRPKMLGAVAALALGMGSSSAIAQATIPNVGDIMLVGFAYCPSGWDEAAGQLLAIAQYPTLYQRYMTTYGGDGKTTFALPDLRGRVPLETGQGPGLAYVALGEKLGASTTTLTVAQMPSHSHQLMAATTGPESNLPSGGLLASYPEATPIYTDKGQVNQRLNAGSIASIGQDQPYSNFQPTLAMRYCVALTGK